MAKNSGGSIRAKIKARKRCVVNEPIEGLGEVPILKLDVNDMIALGTLPKEQQNRAMVAKCVMDEDGEPVFADAKEVGEGEYDLFQRLLVACYNVNGIKGKIETAAGN
jgi:hypothetical protein